MVQLKQLITGFSLWKLRFNPGLVHVIIIVDKVAVGQIFARALPFFTAPMLQTHLSFKAGTTGPFAVLVTMDTVIPFIK
jgi:branched-subunit amino acid transport protein AzlD